MMDMKSNILVVEDDPVMLDALKDSIEISSDKMAVVTACDGLAAIQKLQSNPVNLVVTDYRMPRMDGLSLMGEINKNFPDIPVIIVTGHGSPETEYMARNTGAVGYIVKPFKIHDLITKIADAINAQSSGGTLHNVSAATFLQLIKMEEHVCTVRLTENCSKKQGVLFFKDGNLLDARYKALRAEEAAYEIFSWDDVSLQIQNGCPVETSRIRKGLQAILMDAMLLKDEKKQRQAKTGGKPQINTPKPLPRAVPAIPAGGKISIATALGKQIGVDNIFQDTAWKPRLTEFSRLGSLFDSGRLKVAYIVKNLNDRYILLPEKDCTVITVNADCRRDELLGNLARIT